MPENRQNKQPRQIEMRYYGRYGQVWIFLGKLMRMFLYQGDWKVLPMSALIAGLVGVVIKDRLFIYMEGTLMGALAMACVCVWNGCFNSIQVICRERDVIKREHRSGMHISSYIVSHMIYQALLCLLQTGITIYITAATGVKYPVEGLITPLFFVDFGISLFMITYAADMMSLWISALCRTTTTAMTIMPVVLIFQLIFSGGMVSLPKQAEPVTQAVICNRALKLICTQADYNNQELAAAWNTVWRMRKNEIKTTVTVGQVLDILARTDDPQIQKIREVELTDGEGLLMKLTVGDLVDMLNEQEGTEEFRANSFEIETTVGDIMKLIGQNEIRSYILKTSSESAMVEEYQYTRGNVAGYWADLILFAMIFAALAMITLEFIDHDKR